MSKAVLNLSNILDHFGMERARNASMHVTTSRFMWHVTSERDRATTVFEKVGRNCFQSSAPKMAVFSSAIGKTGKHFIHKVFLAFKARQSGLKPHVAGLACQIITLI
jgi:hypothetical protein